MVYLFQAYAAGCNIVILASNFERVQIIPGAIHGYIRIGSLDCSTDTGKIAAAYGAEVCIFEPTPLIHSAATTHVSYYFGNSHFTTHFHSPLFFKLKNESQSSFPFPSVKQHNMRVERDSD